MAKRCQITGKTVMSGNNVSHANNRTRRRFLPNLQSRRLHSEVLNRRISLRVSTSAMRTVEKHGGLDAYLLQARNAELAAEARELKREIAAAKLVKISKGSVAGFIFVINLFDLGGCDNLIKSGYKVENLIEFPGH